jgi:DNA-binding NarL/FixJ family response regulator
MKQVRVALQTTDPIIRAGLIRFLQFQPGLQVLPESETAAADVLAVATHRLTTEHIAYLRRHANDARIPAILLIDEITEEEFLTAVLFHVRSILPLSSVTQGHLVRAVRAAPSGGGTMPPTLTGLLLKHLRHLQHEVFTRHGLTPSQLTAREIEVIRLVADGMQNKEIAATLGYADRTVENLLKAVSRRLNLRTRPQTVAYAIRTGAI